MIGEWHKRMQDLFPNDWLEKYSSNRNNRADVLNEEHKLVLEVQNSYCQNCEEKTNAWKDNGYNVIWLFNGKHAEVDPCLDLAMCQMIITITKKISELVVFIYVDDDHVYPIQTCSFKKYTSKVTPISINLFVSKFIDGTIQDIVPNVEKIKVSIRQDPPGSGKTFSMTRKAIDNTEYKTVVILCQHHSPNAVIKRQIQQHTGWECEEYNKAFKFKKNERIILIATMDSLMHTLSQGKCENSRDQFSAKAKYISNNGCSLSPLGNCTLKDETIRFCCKTWVIVDEATKTPSAEYMPALHKLITETGSDLHICGDVLQSTNESENLMKNCKTYFTDFDFEEGNEVRRFGVAGTDLLNHSIPYEKLPVERPVPHPDAPTDTDIFCHKYDVNIFLHYLKNDIDELDLKPNDIMVICVPTYDEKFLDLHEKINNLFCVDETQSGWNAYLHKSEEGKPVDLSLSDDAVRMVSIHTSQGDGRKLVYVVGISHYNIEKYVRDDPDHNIKYWSFVNVALSRMERRMRIFIDKFDSLTEKFKHLFNDKDDKIKLHTETKLKKNTIRSSETHEYCNLETLQDVRNQNILQTVTNSRTNQTEWSDHVFCRAVFYYKIMEFFSEKERFTRQIYAKFSKNISDKFIDRRNNCIYIPKFKSKIETYKNILNTIEQINKTKEFSTTVECISTLAYVMTERRVLEPFKLYEIFEKRDVLIEMIEPVINVTNKHFRKIYEIIGDDNIEYQNISHSFKLNFDEINITTRIPIIILTTTKTYCVYPVNSMDRIYTENTIVQSYVDSIILSNCERDETSVPQEFEMNKKCVKSYLYSITCGTFQEITPQCNDICKELLKSHIYNKYERFFDNLYDMYDTDYSILTSKKDSLTETWIKDIIGASVVDAEDDDKWDKERFLKKLNNKLTKVISSM